MARRKKRKKDKGVLAYFPPKRRKDVKALIRALGLVFVKAEMTGQCNDNGRLVGR